MPACNRVPDMVPMCCLQNSSIAWPCRGVRPRQHQRQHQRRVARHTAAVTDEAEAMPGDFNPRPRRVWTVLAALVSMLATMPVSARDGALPLSPVETEPAACSHDRAETVQATANGGLILPDGTGLRLADTLSADRLPDITDANRIRLREARADMLASVVSVRSLVACALAADPDRYGRIVGDAVDPKHPFSLRRHLVAEGLALVHPRPRVDTCCAALYRAEASARRAGKGVWAEPAGLIRRIDRRTGSTNLPLSDFAIVEGRVLSVGDRERDLYLNFGHRWSTDFTITVSKTAFSGTEKDLQRLAGLDGKWIRVRGVSDAWQGGRIQVIDPDQIEILSR